ncbi:MAG: hypothetical protein VSS75_014615 [Candidatus Parabeggiatoa sp.]|nr:hypothetical protein [Candidatus Parabeggiatoa sp.]
MSIKSSPFGGVPISGEEAKQFIKQLRDDKPKQAAIDSFHRGHKFLKKYQEKSDLTFYLQKTYLKKCQN